MLEIVALILIFTFSLVLLYKNFDYAMYVLLLLSVLLHKELFSFYKWDLLPIRAFMVALLAAVGLKLLVYLKNKGSVKALFKYLMEPPFLLLAVLWLVRGVSMVFSLNLNASVLLFGFFTTTVLMTALIYFKYKDSPSDALKYLRFYIYIVFGLTLFGYVQIYYNHLTGRVIGAMWPIPGNTPRVGSTFWDVNHYGALVAALIPILSVLIVTEGTIKRKLLNVVMLLSMLVALFLTNSRSAWILEAVALFSFLSVLFVRKTGWKGVAYFVLTLVLLSVPVLVAYSNKESKFRAEVKQYFHYRLDSFDSHMMLLTGAVQIFSKYPILGGGYGSFFEQFSKTPIAPTFFGRDPAALNARAPAHTIWGELVAETGVVGLSVFILFSLSVLFVLLYNALKAKEKREVLLSAAMFAVYVGWMCAGIFYSYNSEFFWIVIALFLTYGTGLLHTAYMKTVTLSEVYTYFLKAKNSYLFLISVLAAALIFGGLGSTHLIPWDEAIYAKISKNMVVSNNYLVENWVPGKVWYEKPPLYMWFMSLFMHVVGFNSWGARLPSAIFGFLTVLVVYLVAKKMFNKTAGFISAFALLTTVHFLYYSRASMLDVTTTFFVTSALVLYYFSRRPKGTLYWLLAGLLTGAAMMTKGVIGLLPFPVIFLYEVYLYVSKQQKFSGHQVLNYLTMILGALGISLPWHILMYRDFGPAFINNYIGYHVLDRAVSSIEDKGKPFLWYVTVMKVSMRLWFIALLGALPLTLFTAIKKRDNRHIFLLIWGTFIFLFFSVAKSKLVWYIIPIYPAVSLMVGHFLERSLNFVMNKFKLINTFAFKVMAMYVFIVVGLTYLFINKNMVYTSDLTGAEATLLELKDSTFGADQMVYLDRIEQPLALFYSDGPYKVIDFNPTKKDRVPNVSYDQKLVLLTKLGRYSDTVVGITYAPKVVAQQGDWILWYFDSEHSIDQSALDAVNTRISDINNTVARNYKGNLRLAPVTLQTEYSGLLVQQKQIQDKITLALSKK